MKITKSMLLAAASIALSIFLTACHTVQGAGQDVSDTGQTISNAAAAATPDNM